MAKGTYKYHYFYKITNLINNHFYYGIHSTNNLDDGYMGSGSRLHHAYKKYGIENFEKEILKYFDTREELAQYEADVVTEELVLDQNCYNVICGGDNITCFNGMVGVIDKNGNIFKCRKTDSNYLNGEYDIMITCYDTLELKYVQIPHNLLDWNRYIPSLTGKVIARKKGESGKYYAISKEQYNNKEYEMCSSNKIPGKDKYGNFYQILKDDPRVLSGEIIHVWQGKHHKDETKQKMHETHLKNGHQQGEKNSQFRTCWIHNDNESIKIKKEQLEEYISNGWTKGRKMKF